MTRTAPKRAQRVDDEKPTPAADEADKLCDRVVPNVEPIRAECSSGTVKRLAEAGLILQTRGGDDDRAEA